MQNVLVPLDPETKKIWDKIPYGQKAATIRQLLKTLVEEPETEGPPSIIESFGQQSDDSSTWPKHNAKHEKSLSETAATVKRGFRSSKRKQTENMTEQLLDL